MIDLSKMEWYDNSTIDRITVCPRKNFLAKDYHGGRSAGVGVHANVGTVLHAGLARYYSPETWDAPENTRRLAALRTISIEYSKQFPHTAPDNELPAEISDEPPKKISNAHKLSNLIDIADDYFGRYVESNSRWRPVEVEIFLCVEIKPDRPWDKDFLPFFYIMRADGVMENLISKKLYVLEHKTTTGVQRKIKTLGTSRQVSGYVYCLREFLKQSGRDPLLMEGVLANVICVAAEKRESARDVFYKTTDAVESWRKQTIMIVENWRRMKKSYEETQDLDFFLQHTDACGDFGGCAFYEACYFADPRLALKLPENTWTPLKV